MSLSMSLDDPDSDFYSELDSAVTTPSRARRPRSRSLSRTSDFTTDDDDHQQHHQAAAAAVHDHDHDHEDSSFATLTSFDAYFLHASRPARTSSNIFSQLVQPLSPDEYATSLSRSFYPHPFPSSTTPSRQSQSQTGQPSLVEGEETAAAASSSTTTAHRAYIPRYLLELTEGFNLLFYGFGSKRRALNDLARACSCAHTTTRANSYSYPYTHVLVLNGFLPSFSARDILVALARLPGSPQSVEDVAQFLTAEPVPSTPSSSRPPSTSAQKPRQQPQQERRQRRRRLLVLIVHNIDTPALRSSKVRALLNALISLPSVQIAASIDHINAPMIWTSTELLSRKWLWHDLTTLAPYDVELAGADPSSLRSGALTTAAAVAMTSMRTGAGGLAESMGGAGGVMMMTETAARHILAAVTQRARKLFMLMGRRQLDALTDNAGGAGGVGAVEPTTPAGAVEVAVPYDTLFNLARDKFVATNDTALRALLGEFRDHGLVVTVGTGVMGSGEMLWIPLRKERLTKLLDGLTEQAGQPP